MSKGSERTEMGAGLAHIRQLDGNTAGQRSTSEHVPQHPVSSSHSLQQTRTSQPAKRRFGLWAQLEKRQSLYDDC